LGDGRGTCELVGWSHVLLRWTALQYVANWRLNNTRSTSTPYVTSLFKTGIHPGLEKGGTNDGIGTPFRDISVVERGQTSCFQGEEESKSGAEPKYGVYTS